MLEPVITWITEDPFLSAGVAGFLVWRAFQKVTGRGGIKGSVKKIHDSQQKMFHDGFRWQHVDLKSIRGIDLTHYEKVTQELAELGFQVLGDVEYLHITESEPKMRTGLRVFGIAHGAICAATYHVKVRGLNGLLALLITRSRHFRVTDFETALSDGRWVQTTNAGSAVGISTPNRILRYNVPSSVSIAGLHEMHIKNVRQHLVGANPPLPILAHTLEQKMGLEAQQHAVVAEHRKKTGAFTDEELAHLCPDISEGERRKLVAEAAKLKEVAGI